MADPIGSSPPVRGTRRARAARSRERRFIPACAGNTRIPSASVPIPSVHPRLCGEHDVDLLALGANHGSSPPVRGTLDIPQRLQEQSRFIPACAGNTSIANRYSAVESVHPRLCGEHSGSPHMSATICGSSPPVRGTPRSAANTHGKTRFIPACAGNTSVRSRRPPQRPVHPRLCGEHERTPSRSVAPFGSSPPVRGTPLAVRPAVQGARFIPACAGNTQGAAAVLEEHAVHPRLCGEHVQYADESEGGPGSSPPVRGTRRASGADRCAGRFIPACAGNT